MEEGEGNKGPALWARGQHHRRLWDVGKVHRLFLTPPASLPGPGWAAVTPRVAPGSGAGHGPSGASWPGPRRRGWSARPQLPAAPAPPALAPLWLLLCP